MFGARVREGDKTPSMVSSSPGDFPYRPHFPYQYMIVAPQSPPSLITYLLHPLGHTIVLPLAPLEWLPSGCCVSLIFIILDGGCPPRL
jgi:hypothetical protein